MGSRTTAVLVDYLAHRLGGLYDFLYIYIPAQLDAGTSETIDQKDWLCISNVFAKASSTIKVVPLQTLCRRDVYHVNVHNDSHVVDGGRGHHTPYTVVMSWINVDEVLSFASHVHYKQFI